MLKDNNVLKTKIGVWLNKKKAVVVTLYNGEVSLNTILSNIEHFHTHGGSGIRLKGGPQNVVHDSKYLEHEKHQLKKYFNNIALEIKEAHAIVLFGPAETRENFYKELNTYYKNISTKVKDVVKTDNMTTRQVKAWVKTFFQSTN